MITFSVSNEPTLLSYNVLKHRISCNICFIIRIIQKSYFPWKTWWRWHILELC